MANLDLAAPGPHSAQSRDCHSLSRAARPTRRRGRSPARARCFGHPAHSSVLARWIPPAPRSRRPCVQMERFDDSRQDRRCRRTLGASRVDEPEYRKRVGNRELDVIVEHEPFARQMEEMFLHDLRNATEVVLQRNRVRAPGAPSRRHGAVTSGGGSGSRFAAGAVRVGNTVAAAVTNTRVLEANVALIAGAILAVLAALVFK